MDIKAKVGQRIKELRLLKKISQETLANIAEIDRTYMTSVEKGKRNIAVVNLEKIITALGIDYPTFFNDQIFKK
ncbi:MAG: helix-turn-helix transcriptional regulator [Chitinophagales bacterium]|nr:helix-turn-helix transcriptional regulator [Chitinophagales bacterium]